jgi:hypothetical protein
MIYTNPKFGFEQSVNKLYALEISSESELQDLDSDWDANIINILWNNVVQFEFKWEDHLQYWVFLEKAVLAAGYPAPILMMIYQNATYSIKKLVEEGIYSGLGNVHTLNSEFEDRDHVIRRSKNALRKINQLAKIIGQPELSIDRS